MTNVVNGASLNCSFGTTPATLTVTPEKMVTSSNMPAGTVMDFKPVVNIPTFGMCNATTNPAVIAATSAASGVHTPAPCVPVVTSPWTPGSAKVKIKGMAALTPSCTTKCQWLGVITIASPGQAKVSMT